MRAVLRGDKLEGEISLEFQGKAALLLRLDVPGAATGMTLQNLIPSWQLSSSSEGIVEKREHGC